MRERQLLEGHVSLREAIAFAEGDHLYELLGPDHLAPAQVARTQLSQLPTNYIPTADLTVQGHLMPCGTQVRRAGLSRCAYTSFQVISRLNSECFRDAGTIQGAFRSTGRAAAELTSPGKVRPGTGRVSAFVHSRAVPLGLRRPFRTLLLIAEARVQDVAQRESLLSALASLKALVQPNLGSGEDRLPDESGRPGDDDSRDRGRRSGGAKPTVLCSVHISLSIRWRTAEGDDCALIGPPATDSVPDQSRSECGESHSDLG